MRRETENIVLLLAGVALASVVVNGAFTRYVKPGMLAPIVASAVVLIGLAVAAIVADIRSGPGRSHDDGHGHRGGIAWLLVVPVVMLIFIVPPALSARAVAPATLSGSRARPFPPLPAGHAPTVPLPEVLMRIATGSSDTLTGRLITVTGFIMKDHGEVYLGKIVIVCCAADAQLARLHLTGAAEPAAVALPENTWVKVEATVPAGQTYAGPSSIPTIEANTLERIDPPANTYGS